MRFDRYEWQILEALQQDGRLTNQQLAERIGLSPTPCWRRVQALSESGVIRRYAALLDAKKVGIGEIAFAHVTVRKQGDFSIEQFEQAVRERPEVLECYASMGDADYLLKLAIPDVSAYDRFLQQVLFKLPNVLNVTSNFALRAVKQETALPLESYRDRVEG